LKGRQMGKRVLVGVLVGGIIIGGIGISGCMEGGRALSQCKIAGTPAPRWVCEPATDPVVVERGLVWAVGSADEMPLDAQKIVATGNAQENLVEKLVKEFPKIPQPIIKGVVKGQYRTLRVWRNPSSKQLYLLLVLPRSIVEKLNRVALERKELKEGREGFSKNGKREKQEKFKNGNREGIKSKVEKKGTGQKKGEGGNRLTPYPPPTNPPVAPPPNPPVSDKNKTEVKYKIPKPTPPAHLPDRPMDRVIPKPKPTNPLPPPPTGKARIILSPISPPKNLQQLDPSLRK